MDSAADFDSAYLGSIPSIPAKLKDFLCLSIFLKTSNLLTLFVISSLVFIINSKKNVINNLMMNLTI